MDHEKIILEIKEKLKDKYDDFLGIHFFGSRAKGEYHKDSDMDVVVLFKDVYHEKELEIYGIVGYIEYKYEVFIDIKILTPERFEFNPFFYEEVINYGKNFGR